MKKLLLLLPAILWSLLTFAQDGEFTIGNLTYKILDPDNHTVEVRSNSTIEGDLIIPSTVTCDGIEYTVTEIAAAAFSYCMHLKTVEIPNTVTSIGKSAFRFCFELTDVEIPSSATFIGEMAFSSCSGLTSINIPHSITTIEPSAFSVCVSLEEVNCASDNPAYSSIGGVLFNKDLTTLAIYPGGKKDEEYQIPSSVTTLEAGSFYGNDKLTSIEIPNSVETIGAEAFKSCSSLTSVRLPNSVTILGDEAFASCYALTAIEFSSSITSINPNVLSRCSSLVDIICPDENPNYSSQGGVLFNKDLTILVKYPAGLKGDYRIPESVTTVGSYAFYYCYNLTSLIVPGSVSTIGDGTFFGCSALETVELPNSLTSIGRFAFAWCSELTSVYLPASVRTIGDSSFENCGGIKEVYYAAENPIEAAGNIFSNSIYSEATLYVPAAAMEKARTTEPWSLFTNIDELTTNIKDGEFTIGNLAYKILDPDNHTVEVRSNGTIEGNLIIPSTVTCDGKVFTVTEIAAEGFSSQYQITSVEIPNSVTSIGERAFFYCSMLSNVEIPSSVTIIGQLAFLFCELTSVNIPCSVTNIEMMAFSGCGSLVEINCAADNPNYSSLDGVLFNKGLTTLEIYPSGRRGGYSIPSSVTTLAEGSFSRNDKLTSIEIPNSVETVGGEAFSVCTSLTSVKLPNSVTVIGDAAFAYCYALKEIELSASITSIHSSVFSFCSSLENIICPADNPNYSSQDGALFNKDLTTLVKYPAGIKGDYRIPESVTTVGSGSFYYCDKLTSVTFPNSVTYIGSQAFQGCTALESIEMPDSITTIGRYAFAWCSELTSVYLPASVRAIGDYSFENCGKIKEVYYAAENPIKAYRNIFDDNLYSDATLYVPAAAMEKARTTEPWRYFNTIEAHDFSSSIETVDTDFDHDAPVEVYSLSGIKLTSTLETLPAGIYVVRSKGKSYKITVK